MKYILTLSIVFSLSLTTVSAEFDTGVLKNLNSYVYDQAGVLNEAQEEKLNRKIEEIRESTTAEVLVVVLNITDEEDISALGVRIGEEVGVGKADVDNGVVILVAVDDREWNISTGYGVEGILPDARTKRIGEVNFLENFRAGNYGVGLLGSLNDIGWFLEQDPEVVSKYNKTKKDELVPVGLFFWMMFMFFGGFVYKKNEKKKIRWSKYGVIVGVTTLVLYFLLPILMLFINALIHSLVAYFYDKVEIDDHWWNDSGGSGWWRSNSWWWGSSRSSRWSFGGGSFGGGWSRGKW